MLKLILHCIMLQYNAPLDILFLDIHMQMCVPLNIDLINFVDSFNFLMWAAISLKPY